MIAEIAQLVEHNLAKVGVASSSLVFRSQLNAQVAELVDAHVSGACVERRAGSSPVLGTSKTRVEIYPRFFCICMFNVIVMDYVYLILAVLCAVLGIAGAVLPVLTGPPISYAALWIMWLRNPQDISSASLWIMGILMLVVSLLDYVAPVWLTNKGGGSPSATRGATAGMIVGLFFPPWGLLLGPFLGAFLGELMAHAPAGKALRVALLSFVGFLLTTGFKLAYGVAVLIMMW